MENKTISVSGVMDFCESPFHFYTWNILKDRPESTAMLEGRALHLAVLEPEKFEDQVYTHVRVPNGYHLVDTVDDLKAYIEKRGVPVPKGKKEVLVNTFKELRDEFAITKDELLLMYADKTLLTEKSYENTLKMQKSVRAHEFVKRYIDQEGDKELYLKGEVEGVEIRGRIDWVFYSASMNQYIVNDLKKTTSAKRRDWERTILARKYFIQAWLYMELIRQNFGKDCLYSYVVVEGASPFITEVYAADDGQLDAGEQLTRLKLNQYKKCLDENKWPTYSDGKIQPCSLPKYGFDEIDYILNNSEQL